MRILSTMVSEEHLNLISTELHLQPNQVQQTVQLLDEGSTIPFISRYRKEATGNLDEVQVGAIQKILEKFRAIDKRRSLILKSIEKQEKLTPDLQKKLQNSWSLTELEDLYLPFKPKRKTRGQAAVEKGLEPLAKHIYENTHQDAEALAGAYLNDQVPSQEEALKGAREIVAEWINETQTVREALRKLFQDEGWLMVTVIEGKEAEGSKYKDYFQFKECISKLPSHRILAIFRAEQEGMVSATLQPEEQQSLDVLDALIFRNSSWKNPQLVKACSEAYKRLLRPSLENEFRSQLKDRADLEAIEVFAENLRQLLLSAPLGPRPVFAVDPGYRTGCKVVALDKHGSLLKHDVIFPLENKERKQKAAQVIRSWVSEFNLAAGAVGNGTAGRETEEFLRGLQLEIPIFMVSESGASVYSASEAARVEFPEFDLTVRGAISIGRRLMDPLSELVKLDPKAIGVGQYQHDVNQRQLKQSLDRVVESCVNTVGVNLNTASKQLLSYVSGLGPSLAENILQYRASHGTFRSRRDLRQVSKLGEKSFEQCAGFLRIPESIHPLDNSAVHPERYPLVEQMAADLGCTVEDLLKNKKLRSEIKVQTYVSKEIGLPTLQDILRELEKPGRDPRGEVSIFEYSEHIHSLEDLQVGMDLPGIVTNITNFGAFVDIGVKQDGLVHISEMSNRFISNPNEVVKLNQKVKVRVLDLDIPRKRISLSMKPLASASPNQGRPKNSGGLKEPGTNSPSDPLDFTSSLKALRNRFRS